MKLSNLSTLLCLGFAASAYAETVVFSDNFNAPTTSNFDASEQTGRKSGLLAADVSLRSARFQHGISNNRLRIKRTNGSGRIRFHDSVGRYNFAAGPVGAQILADGGLRIEFDWWSQSAGTASATPDDNWVAISVGISAPPTAEPSQRVNDAQTDFGVLFRNNGNSNYFDNGVSTTAGTFPRGLTKHRAVAEYSFTSLTDGTMATANVWADGVKVVDGVSFDWDNNAGVLHLEIGGNLDGYLIDNLKVSTLSTGDTDSDGIDDEWEMTKIGNISALGAAPADLDGDGMTDVDEFLNSRRLGADLNPNAADSDGDGLSDSEELAPAFGSTRAVTNPGLADTDEDGLSDSLESNDPTLAGGTSPLLVDSDADNFPDAYELVRGTDPLNISSFPGVSTLPAEFGSGIVTDDASTGLSSAETYTVKLSGGLAATVNGVPLDLLNGTVTPANFIWNGGVGGKAVIGAVNNNSWVPANGGVQVGTGVHTMFGTLAYSPDGSTFTNSQRYELTNLEVGRKYEVRLYYRKWGNNTARAADLQFINGSTIHNAYVTLDRPDQMVAGATVDTAWYLSYSYTAAAPSLIITATVPRIAITTPAANGSNGSHHLYGLTNRVAGPPADDQDLDLISDAYELAVAGNLTTLQAHPADFDSDGASDKTEADQSVQFIGLNPLDPDSDDDTLTDGAELTGVAPRPPTNPVRADTDNDTLSDAIESNTGIFVSAANPGTNPTTYDSDGDLYPDTLEIARGSDPNQATSLPTLPSGFTVGVLTDDASTGISVDKTYTHKIAGGAAASINGVDLDLLNATNTLPNFTWLARNPTGGGANKNLVANNLGAWLPVDGNVTGPGLEALLSSFVYSGNGDLPNAYQSWTCSGLLAGQQYILRLYFRTWAKNGSGRPHQVTFTNGATVSSAYILEDRPGSVIGDASNQDVALYLEIPYTAEASSVTFEARVPSQTSVLPSGSWHLYGLTNEWIDPIKFEITGVTYAATPIPTATVVFKSIPGATYQLEYSTAMTAAGTPDGWTLLAPTVMATGLSSSLEDTVAVGTGGRIFYRVRKLP